MKAPVFIMALFFILLSRIVCLAGLIYTVSTGILVFLYNYYKFAGVIRILLIILTFLPCIAYPGLKVSPDSVIQSNNPLIESNIYYGKIFNNYPDFPERKNSLFIELGLTYQTDGSRKWHSIYYYPQAGVSLIFGELGNNEVFGQNISILPHLSFTHFRNRMFKLETGIGFGFSYFNRIYDATDNPDNLLIGSAVTNITCGSASLKINISDRMILKGGISFLHFSNGHYQLPNIGLNCPAANLGVKYYLNTKPVIPLREKPEPYKGNILFNVRLGFGMHEFGVATKPLGGPKYPIYMCTAFVSRRYTRINNVHAGLFIHYYTSFYDYIIDQEMYDSNRSLNSMCLSAFLGHEFLIGRIGLVTQCGFNFYNPFPKDYILLTQDKLDIAEVLENYISNKLGMQYYFSGPSETNRNKLFVGLYIKAKFGVADFVEYAIGYSF